MSPVPERVDPVDPVHYYLDVDLTRIHPSTLNPRRSRVFDPELGELAESIRLYGVLEPIVVRTSTRTNTAGAMYEIVAGFRRYEASKLAGKESIPAIHRDTSDQELLEIALAENLHRMGMTAIDEAKAIRSLKALDPAYRDNRALAAKIGRSEAYVAGRERLLRLVDRAQDALECEAITEAHAFRLATVPRTQQLTALHACFSRLFVEDVVEAVDLGQWPALRAALLPVTELDEWIKQHTTTHSDALQEALGEDFKRFNAQDAVEPHRLSQADWRLTTGEAKRLEVLRPHEWVEVKRKKDACPFTSDGVVVHGGAPAILKVCVARKACAKHFPKPETATKPKASRAQQTAEANAAAAAREAEAWERDQVPWCRALARLMPKITPYDAIRANTDSHSRAYMRKMFGLELTAETAGQWMFLQRSSVYMRETFLRSMKRLKITRRRLEAEVRRSTKRAAIKREIRSKLGRKAPKRTRGRA